MRRSSSAQLSRPDVEQQLSRRERQIMDILFARGRASGTEILENLSDQPSYSSVRTILRVLERKGFVRHGEEGLRYVYVPTVGREKARRSALERVVNTFFDGSAKKAAAAFLDPGAFSLTKAELNELALMIEKARKEAK
ncbi:MAG: BlaI/MecI/CopY family transcriptional regulator [Acidobacteriaceae bacterium]|nr:BlaI/MecI/CopY family transcriptional regulator [Acidobacteriaceae bacterium]